jgi:hypothetical protein
MKNVYRFFLIFTLAAVASFTSCSSNTITPVTYTAQIADANSYIYPPGNGIQAPPIQIKFSVSVAESGPITTNSQFKVSVIFISMGFTLCF